jgi:hypothetical protein
VQVEQLAPGLWGWSARHPGWRPGARWDEAVWCYHAEADQATLLIDPLLPPDDRDDLLGRLDAEVERRALPVRILLTASHHRRSADELAARYDAEIWDGEGALPQGVDTFRVEHPRPVERPFWLSGHRALAFGDALQIVDGELRVWWDVRWAEGEAWYYERLLPSLRALLALPVEHVLVGHGGPAPGAELAAALERPPCS